MGVGHVHFKFVAPDRSINEKAASLFRMYHNQHFVACPFPSLAFADHIQGGPSENEEGEDADVYEVPDSSFESRTHPKGGREMPSVRRIYVGGMIGGQMRI